MALGLEQTSGWGDYAGGEELSEALGAGDVLPRVRLGPGARHVHVLGPRGRAGLLTCARWEGPRPLRDPRGRGPLRSRPDAHVVDVLDLGAPLPEGGVAAVVAVVYQDGKAEFWRSGGDWRLLQASELCNSARARVVSVCAPPGVIVWCEERPPSGGPGPGSAPRYCVCRRGCEVDHGGSVVLGGVKVLLHNNPRLAAVASGDSVHLLPDPGAAAAGGGGVPGFVLTWSPRRDAFAVSTLCRNAPLKRLSAKESDFKKLVVDCLGFLSALSPPAVYDYAAAAAPGGLLLLLDTGRVSLLREDGTTRQLCAVADNRLMAPGTHTSLCLYEDTLALVIGHDLHLVDAACGRPLEKVALKGEGLLYVNQAKRGTPHLLSRNGLFVVASKEAAWKDGPKAKPAGMAAAAVAERFHPGAPLIEAVFEEACKYYQQRSLSSTLLTADMLRRGGMFQAPIALASILRSFLSRGRRQKGAALSQNGDVGLTAGQAKLMGSLEAELEALVSLEEVKSSLVRASAKEVEALCEGLVEKEVARLLSAAAALDGEALLYLNYIADVFPRQAWNAAQAALQLRCNGEGSLSSGAPPDVWKTILTPAAAAPAVSNGRPESARRLKSSPLPAPPAALPAFELLCRSVFHFQPAWLPRFLELAQQQQGAAGLGLSLASSSWSFPRGRGGGSGGGEGGGEGDAPLYKRALGVVAALSRDRERRQELEVELLLVSGRPNAVLQALRILMGQQQWARVVGVAQDFCCRSPLLNRELFTTLLCEVGQHRDLDPYLELLWALCPDDLTVTTILNLVLKNLGSPSAPPPPPLSPPPSFPVAGGLRRPAPFAGPQSSQLTVGLLKPLLRKVLQREAKPSQHYADILQSPSFPPPAPPRQPAEQRAGAAAAAHADAPPPLETPEQQTSAAHACPTSAC